MDPFDQADQIVNICTGCMPCLAAIAVIFFIVFVVRRGNKPSFQTRTVQVQPVETRACSNCGKSFLAAPDRVESTGDSVRKQFTCPHCKTQSEYAE